MTQASGAGGTGRVHLALGALLAGLPWLNPFAAGPSPAVQPWLTSAACALGLWLLTLGTGTGAGAAPRLLLPASALVAWSALAHGVVPETAMLAAALLLVGIAAGLARDAGTGTALCIGLLLAAVLSACAGLLQYFGVAGRLAPWVSSAQVGEAYANLRQPNLYASLCWLGVAVVLWRTARLPLAARAALVAFLAAACAASVSRTGMLQGIVLTLLVAAWPGPQRRQRLLLCVVGAVAYYAAALLLPLAVEALTGALPQRTHWARLRDVESCSSRMVLWSNVLDAIAQKPWAGWGWGELDYAHYATLYQGERFCDILDNAHNLPLHLAVELGVPAALLVCGGALWWAWRRQPWREAAGTRQLAWAIVAVILVHSLLEYPLWYGPFQIAFGAALGWLHPPAGQDADGQPRARRELAAIVLLFLAAAYAALDYTRVSQIYVAPEERLATLREDTLAHANRSWLFSGQARFAELTLESVNRANAAHMNLLARQVLHYSPEPRVIERAIESATMLGRTDEAVRDLARFRAAFPREYEAWRGAARQPLPASP